MGASGSGGDTGRPSPIGLGPVDDEEIDGGGGGGGCLFGLGGAGLDGTCLCGVVIVGGLGLSWSEEGIDEDRGVELANAMCLRGGGS